MLIFGKQIQRIWLLQKSFVSGDYQQKGIGKSLSDQSIEVLKKMDAKAILCHSWLESPGNSSQRYLQKMGFDSVKEHEKFWYPIDYECTRCSPGKMFVRRWK